jgi:hypothetical protein
MYICQMIKLNKYQKDLIKLIKGHYNNEYPFTGEWHDTIKPLFEKHYGWNPDEQIHDYLQVLFKKLKETFLLIAEDDYTRNCVIDDVFFAV